jgi:hypothetical protein
MLCQNYRRFQFKLTTTMACTVLLVCLAATSLCGYSKAHSGTLCTVQYCIHVCTTALMFTAAPPNTGFELSNPRRTNETP